jgi:hypothetical protein
MKKLITAIAVSSAITAIALAKADKLCWIGSTQVWPEAETFGLQARTMATSGGITARVDNGSFAFYNSLSKITLQVNGVKTVNYYTNFIFSSSGGEWKQAITLPVELLCDRPDNWAQVQMWIYTSQQQFGGPVYSGYGSAKIQGN